MTEQSVVEDPAAGFAALMSGASQAAAPDPGEAPFGYTTDRVTGERRPKKAAGRPGKPPSIEDLKAEREQAEPAEPAQDRAPSRGRRAHRRSGKGKPAADEPGMPQHRPGLITKGVNRLYRKAGKVVRVMDPDIGIAIIESARNTAEDGEPDDSVGAAWDEVARTNPRIRRFLLKMIAGGAWGQLLMAHAPILLAILLKDSIRRHIPFMQLITAYLGDDGDQAAGDGPAAGGLFDGLRPEDAEQMMAMAQQMMGGMAGRVVPDGRAAG